MIKEPLKQFVLSVSGVGKIRTVSRAWDSNATDSVRWGGRETLVL